jgi:hypothetical protein
MITRSSAVAWGEHDPRFALNADEITELASGKFFPPATETRSTA